MSWDAWDFLSEVQRPVSLTALEELTLSVRSIQPDWILSSDPPFYDSKYLHTLHLNISYEVKSYPFLEALLTKTVRVLTVDCAAGIFEDFLRPLLDLSQLQRITHMSLTRIHWTDATPDPTFPMATLMNLQELIVDGSVLGLSRLLAVLTLPSLVKLSLSSKTYPSDGWHGPIVGPAPAEAVRSTRSSPISLEHSFAKYTDTLSKGQILALGAIIFNNIYIY
ncbi:hypothetical protein F5880DRAFT_1511224 [Lentinula raphanica]|nr:hypothetical protein F5880DRAFT_1511224 [Lentinula raphanica]